MSGLGLIIYGIEGIGKTSFSMELPKPLSIMSLKETGYDNLLMVGDVPQGVTPVRCRSWEDIILAIKNSPAKTLVIDSISGMQEYLVEYVTRTVYKGNYAAFKSFYNGLRQDCPREISMMLDQVEILRAKGTHIVFIAHRKQETDPDSSGPDIQVQTLFGDEGITGPLKKWAQAILFMSAKRNVDIVTESAGYGDNIKILEGKSTGEPTRLMYTKFSGSHIAKNTLRLPPVIAMGKSAKESYELFFKALPDPIKKILIS